MNPPATIVATVLSIQVDSRGWSDPSTWAAFAAAAGTIVLAFFTWRLARQTRTLAIETGEDVRAVWRPVLVPGQYPLHGDVSVGTMTASIDVVVKNAGPGPALNVTATCRSISSVDEVTSPPVQLGTLASQWDEVLKVEGLLFRDASGSQGARLTYVIKATYEDLAGVEHESTLEYEDPDRGQRDASGSSSFEIPISRTTTRRKALRSRPTA